MAAKKRDGGAERAKGRAKAAAVRKAGGPLKPGQSRESAAQAAVRQTQEFRRATNALPGFSGVDYNNPRNRWLNLENARLRRIDPSAGVNSFGSARDSQTRYGGNLANVSRANYDMRDAYYQDTRKNALNTQGFSVRNTGSQPSLSPDSQQKRKSGKNSADKAKQPESRKRK